MRSRSHGTDPTGSDFDNGSSLMVRAHSRLPSIGPAGNASGRARSMRRRIHAPRMAFNWFVKIFACHRSGFAPTPRNGRERTVSTREVNRRGIMEPSTDKG
eukprot:4967746-Prymnesium_polylepis.1